MMKGFNFFCMVVLFLGIVFSVHAQEFHNPESVVFDYQNNRYFVSNKGSGEIVEIDSLGNMSYFNEDQTSIRGLHICGEYLYGASSAGVAVVSLETGETVTTVAIDGMSFLNDVTSVNGEYLYITDSNLGRITKMSTSDYSYVTFVSSGINGSNGIIYDEDNDRLIIVTWSGGYIKAINLEDASVTTIKNTGLSQQDGITVDNKGNWYVSSWGWGAVLRFAPDFEGDGVEVSDGHYGPADIFYNQQDLVLAVPNFNSHIVDFIPMSPYVMNVPEDYTTIQGAIDASANGDTVLVAPGIYVENINFRGKNIVVASHFILDNNYDHVYSTIIDGSNPSNPDSASTVSFSSQETEDAVLQGFTVIGGTGTIWIDPQFPSYNWLSGGGIFMYMASPIIKNNRIIDNTITNPGEIDGASGGGIITFRGNPQIINNVIMNNQADYGAGVVVDYSGAVIKNNIVYGNSGGSQYGGAGFYMIGTDVEPIIVENNTIVGNRSETNGGAMRLWSSEVTARNNIIWGNTQNFGGSIYGNLLHLTYSNVEGGYTGEGNIDVNPAFADTINFYLDGASSCIDAGNPDAVYNDPEMPGIPDYPLWPAMGQLINDMGAYGGPDSKILAEVNTDIKKKCGIKSPDRCYLQPNYPNPFNPSTTIQFEIPVASQRAVKLQIYDVSGKLIKALIDGEMETGYHSVVWNGKDDAGQDVASGVYFYRLEGKNLNEIKSMILLK